ncbi:MAG: hypothetical protein PQJ61_06480 [Spirochaetales bacterium]|uniref:Uncharacterized protein n=1 Tax=Candidatus Thalassospirochaeta sargassi TaxID=3119039 RepID=A0AAJ1IEF2_9SPIO|nr:hypothetical protein [Spirochaetales bacterium]
MDKRVAYRLLAAVLLLAILPAALISADTDITIYYTASLNGNLIGCECKGVPKAGLSTTAAYLRELDQSSSIILDLGDFNDARTDELLSNTIMDLYVELGYDVISLGDQELASGVDFFKEASKKLNFICSNIEIDGQALSPEPVIVERKGIKIGIAAVINPDVFFFYPSGVKDRIELGDLEKAAADALDDLEAAGSSYNLLLYHGNTEAAKQFYAQQTGWDAVLSAHDQVLFEQQDGMRLMASPGEEGNRIGMLELSFRGNRLKEVSNTLRYFKYEADPEDEGVLQAFEDYKKELINNLKNGKK